MYDKAEKYPDLIPPECFALITLLKWVSNFGLSEDWLER